MTRRIIAKVIVAILTIYCISVIAAYFYNTSITFPFFVSDGSYVPEHRLKAIRLSVFGTFIFFAAHFFLRFKKILSNSSNGSIDF
ncbi:MAG: hypothetical protein P8L40_01505 [Planktomarina sp.]|nr:hypothetical protein [Planktomarina sp.]